MSDHSPFHSTLLIVQSRESLKFQQVNFNLTNHFFQLDNRYNKIAGVFLSMNGTIINNNSEISIDTIGEKSERALLCLTDLHLFYPDANIYEEVGQWYFPNGSVVEMNETICDIYTSRSQGVVRLHRKNNSIAPTGQFRCEMLDSILTNQSIYVKLITYQKSELSNSFLAEAIAGGVCGLLLIVAGLVLVVFAIRRYLKLVMQPY